MWSLWRHDRSFSGKYVSYDEVSQQPVPVRESGLPVIFGGHAPAAVERAARLGDGLVRLGSVT
jgi:alkanesulfonate monooxygenase SsuD/methylene tetrahydromethanopterin reductase-like flavin-dependent oxidoreductase (luciferase family)